MSRANDPGSGTGTPVTVNWLVPIARSLALKSNAYWETMLLTGPAEIICRGEALLDSPSATEREAETF